MIIDHYEHRRKHIEWWPMTAGGSSGRMVIAGDIGWWHLSQDLENGKLGGRPKPGETVSRHREEKVQSLKKWGKPWPIQETERRWEAWEPNKQLGKWCEKKLILGRNQIRLSYHQRSLDFVLSAVGKQWCDLIWFKFCKDNSGCSVENGFLKGQIHIYRDKPT